MWNVNKCNQHCIHVINQGSVSIVTLIDGVISSWSDAIVWATGWVKCIPVGPVDSHPFCALVHGKSISCPNPYVFLRSQDKSGAHHSGNDIAIAFTCFIKIMYVSMYNVRIFEFCRPVTHPPLGCYWWPTEEWISLNHARSIFLAIWRKQLYNFFPLSFEWFLN
jgi:hypothetical protein